MRRRESGSILEKVLNYLSPRERVVVEGMRLGKSLTEIGDGMGISKQAAHKISAAALKKFRERLRAGAMASVALGVAKASRSRS